MSFFIVYYFFLYWKFFLYVSNVFSVFSAYFCLNKPFMLSRVHSVGVACHKETVKCDRFFFTCQLSFAIIAGRHINYTRP